MTSRLDYCNALLAGCPASSINKLQVVQNTAARVLTRSRKYDHITHILQSLHWLHINSFPASVFKKKLPATASIFDDFHLNLTALRIFSAMNI